MSTTVPPGTPIAEDVKGIAQRLKEIEAEKERERTKAQPLENYLYGC